MDWSAESAPATGLAKYWKEKLEKNRKVTIDH